MALLSPIKGLGLLGLVASRERNVMVSAGKMRVDKIKEMGFLIASIPAKPLAQAKLKCGGFFIAPIRQGGLA